MRKNVLLVKEPEISFLGLSNQHHCTGPVGEESDFLSVVPMGSIMGKGSRLDCREMG